MLRGLGALWGFGAWDFWGWGVLGSRFRADFWGPTVFWDTSPSPKHDPDSLSTPLFPQNPKAPRETRPSLLPSLFSYFLCLFFGEFLPENPVFHRFIHALFAYPGNPEASPGGSQIPEFPRDVFGVDSAPPKPLMGFFFFNYFFGIFPGFFFPRFFHPGGALA